MTNAPDEQHRRSRRAVLRDGIGALLVLFVVGAMVTVPAIQRNLAASVNDELVSAGIDARVDFHGQDGTLRCVDQLADPDTARAIALGVRGVRNVSVDVSCLVPAEQLPGITLPGETAPPSSTEPPTTGPGTTDPATTTTDTGVSTTTTSTTAATSTTAVALDPSADSELAIGLVEGAMNLSGKVASRTQRRALLDAANAAVSPDNVTDQLVVDRTVTITDDVVDAIAVLVGSMPAPLVDGEVGWGPRGVYATGVYVDDTARATFEDAAGIAGATVLLQQRPAASAGDASVMQQDLNALVAEQPFVFARGGTEIGVDQQGLLHRVAGIAKRFGGTSIEVQGYTDSEGDAGRNLTLSRRRAQSVADALVQLGVPESDVSVRGFGETDPVTDENGREIPELSRRVVFGVTINS